MPRKILFLTPHPIGESPSQRFRFEQYFSLLLRSGFTYEIHSFLDNKGAHVLREPGNFFRKATAVLHGFARRSVTLTKLTRFDFIFIHREAAPIGPPLVEWIIGRLLKRKMIYDFDDSIWLTDRKEETFLLRRLKWRSKVAAICRWSYKISCGNPYLCEFALRHNHSVQLIPTTIDTDGLHSLKKFKKENRSEVIIGWTGSHSTLKYLEQLENVLSSVESKYPQVTVWVIADQPPALNLPRLVFKKWSLQTEISDLAQFDIGIMPLPNDDWSKGKCGFKALQYMAMNVPCVISPVGVNSMIITDGKDGFLANSEGEWITALSLLVENIDLRRTVGLEGRNKVEGYYSTASNSEVFLSLFEKS